MNNDFSFHRKSCAGVSSLLLPSEPIQYSIFLYLMRPPLAQIDRFFILFLIRRLLIGTICEIINHHCLPTNIAICGIDIDAPHYFRKHIEVVRSWNCA